MKIENKTNPAFPCVPIQDNLGRFLAPIPGFTKFELAVLNIICSKEKSYNALPDSRLVKDSIDLANEFFKQLEIYKENEAAKPTILS